MKSCSQHKGTNDPLNRDMSLCTGYRGNLKNSIPTEEKSFPSSVPKSLDFTHFLAKFKQEAVFEENTTISHQTMEGSRSASKPYCIDNYFFFRCLLFCGSQCTGSLRPMNCKWKRSSTSPQVKGNRRQETSLHSVNSSERHAFLLFLCSWVPITRSTYKSETPHLVYT